MQKLHIPSLSALYGLLIYLKSLAEMIDLGSESDMLKVTLHSYMKVKNIAQLI